MSEKLTYLTDSYKKTLNSVITSVKKISDTNYLITLNQTIFYPTGGGQPCDQGFLKSKNGDIRVEQVSYIEGEAIHSCRSNFEPQEQDEVVCEIDWDRRYKYMQIHSAGHLLDFAVHALGYTPKPLTPNKGNHSSNAYVEYLGTLDKDIKDDLQNKIDELISKNLKFSTQFKTRKEIEKTSIYVQSGLPSNKPLRVLQLEGVGEVPDGGTQVNSTSELKDTVVTEIVTKEDTTTFFYKIESNLANKKTGEGSGEVSLDMDLSEIVINLQKDILLANDLKILENIKLKYIGRSGIINALGQKIKDIKPEDRANFGKQLNLLKFKVEELLKNAESKGNKTTKIVDNSIPDNLPGVGSLHPTTHAIFQIQDILSQIGFVRKRYREIDDDWHPFKALNMPDNHPARDEWETFFCEDGKWVLTPHTSNGQIWEMENKKPPIKMLNITKTYRRQISPKHSPMFHQFEGLYVDKNVSIAHLKGTLDYFIKGFFGSDRKTRIRPYHFKFTEPSFEVDITCDVCKGKGCKVCKAGWLELGGAGMVHPNVLKNVGIDPKVYNGFAFGFGVERPYMMKGDINIPDIRMFYTTKLDVLKNF